MEMEVMHDMIFPLNAIQYKVTQDFINDFNRFVLDNSEEDEFIAETEWVILLIRKSDKYFKILKRKYRRDNVELNKVVDTTAMMLYKIASRAGFNVHLESKYSN